MISLMYNPKEVFMEFNLEEWLGELTKKLFDTFEGRIKFIGLQGSYKRNEATDTSDVDVIVILDKIQLNDLQSYHKIIQSMPFKEKACGFVSGLDEIYHWPKYELFQLFNDTVSLYGEFKDFVPLIKRTDAIPAVQTNIANLYHMLSHSYLFENNLIETLKQGYKNVFYILQTEYYIDNYKYIETKQELLELLQGEDREMLTICINMKSLDFSVNPDFYFEKLLNWTKKNLPRY